jgi:hypothetical protein
MFGVGPDNFGAAINSQRPTVDCDIHRVLLCVSKQVWGRAFGFRSQIFVFGAEMGAPRLA